MPDPIRHADAAPESTPTESSPGRLAGLLMRLFAPITALRVWAGANRTRGIAISVTLALLIATTIGGWAYLANVAIKAGQATVATTLAALDAGNYEDARSMVGNMLRGGQLPRSQYGGPLYVLGAIKTHDAENTQTPEQRRNEYLVASRYLKEARAYGIPPERESDASFLLGLSLLESNQFEEGIQELDDLLAGNLAGNLPLFYEVHRLLAEMCLCMPRPNLEKALVHNDALLNKPELSADDRADCLLQRAECLARLDRFNEARKTLASIPAATERRAGISLMDARITLDELDAALKKVATRDRDTLLTQWKPKTAAALDRLKRADSPDRQGSFIARQVSYHTGRALELQGDRDAALKQFAETRQLYPESLEGMAAAIAEADLLRQNGDYPAALLGYRRVFETFRGPAIYRSDVMPLDAIRARMMEAVSDFVEHHHFDEAIAMLARFQPMFSRAEQLGIQGDTLQQWGNLLLGGSTDGAAQPNPNRVAALQHLRAAGLAYEQLAELHFATRQYTDDLWKSAENYYRGHSFTSTISQLKKYLQNEPELRNAQALLRLGQAHLALGQVAETIASLEECIEFHPLDGSTYQARIDCAKAYSYEGNTKRSEQLLRDNISGTSLKPSSREWKDSLFELGMLLHETGQYEAAISTLEEAVERYPQDSHLLVAQYLIGESYRRSAVELRDRAGKTRAANERDRILQLAEARLNTALICFEEVHSNITLRTHDVHGDPLMGAMRRNCYMLEGTVLFDLGRYKEAIEAYSNVSSLYPDEPFVLETFVQIANCWRRLGRDDTARLTIKQAQIAVDRLPAESDFATATSFSRDEWRMLLADMGNW